MADDSDNPENALAASGDGRRAAKRIFIAAIELPTPAERSAYLAEACGGDAKLRKRVEALLAVHDSPDPLLDRPVSQTIAATPTDGADAERRAVALLDPPVAEGQIGRLDHYAFLEIVGHGSMGVVFRARDEKLGRVVAIKMLTPALAKSELARRRFVSEARAAAAVSHENVVAVHAVEDHGPIPYLVMQYVHGKTLQAYIDEHAVVDFTGVVRIGLQIAEGLDAAHQQGLVHRDIKPANILLENSVERVKITDFGLAHAIDDAGASQFASNKGTPAFMSPEQACGMQLDQRSDLYSLGCVLYAMCAGSPPFQTGTTLAMLGRITQDEPRPLRMANPLVPEWLAETVHRLIAKDPAARFQRASDVADELRRRLLALQSPASATLAVRTARRSMWRWAGAAAVALLLLAAIVFAVQEFAARRAPKAPRVAGSFAAGVVEIATRDLPVPAAAELASIASPADAFDAKDIRADLLPYTGQRTPQTDRAEVVAIFGEPSAAPGCQLYALALSPDGKTLASARTDGSVELWDVTSAKMRSRLPANRASDAAPMGAVAFDPTGTYLAAGDFKGNVRIWKSSDLSEVVTLGVSASDRITQLAFSPDGKTFAVAAEHVGVQLYSVPEFKPTHRLRTSGDAWAVAFSPDGRTIAYGDSGSVRLCDVASAREVAQLPEHTATIRWIGYRPDGQSIVTAGTHPLRQLSLHTWDARTLERTGSLVGHAQTVLTGAWRADAKLLITAGETEGQLRLWDQSTAQVRCKVLNVMQAGVPWLTSMALSPDGRHLFVAHPKGMIFVVRLAPRGELPRIP